MRLSFAPALLALAAFVTPVSSQPPPAPRLDANGDALPNGAIARLGSLRFQPPRWNQAIALSPDGTVLATFSQGNNENTFIDFMDTATGTSVRKLKLDALGERMQ